MIISCALIPLRARATPKLEPFSPLGKRVDWLVCNPCYLRHLGATDLLGIQGEQEGWFTPTSGQRSKG